MSSLSPQSDSGVVVPYPVPATKPSVSVIVPAFNESAIILETLHTLVDYMHGLDERFRWEIVVVDDGSTDGTGYLAQQAATKNPQIRVLRHRVNFMLGQALRTAFNSCTTDYLVVIDCDLSYSADHIGRLLDTIEETQARVVIASPYMPGGRTTAVPALRNLASRTANQILSVAASGRIRTLTGMVRAYDRRFIASLNLKAMGTEVNTEIIYKAQLLRARIEEIPGHLDWTVIGQLPRRSTVRLANGTIRSLISAFFFKPFAFFIAPGLVTSVAALITLSFALGQPFEHARVTYMLGIFLAAGAIMLLSVGMLALQAKRYFEELFSLGTRVLREVRGESPTPSNFLEDPARSPAPPPVRGPAS
ncbi:MAG TPA: glycosyltransferase family 2 protein [Acidimicrobiia bacterium]|nr:glycosyltransferase family 2 protein [Acidimicrobiia bacterium]